MNVRKRTTHCDIPASMTAAITPHRGTALPEAVAFVRAD